LVVTLLAGLWSTLEGWRAVGPVQWASLSAAAFFLVGGYYFIVNAMRAGDMTLVAPFRYVGLLFALLLGYLVWGEVPNLLAWAGIALLVGSGLHLILRERSRIGPAPVAVPSASRNDPV
jgi:drug/metabolite transporter (DMT)-like permease